VPVEWLGLQGLPDTIRRDAKNAKALYVLSRYVGAEAPTPWEENAGETSAPRLILNAPAGRAP
jgi:hypothetical protein